MLELQSYPPLNIQLSGNAMQFRLHDTDPATLRVRASYHFFATASTPEADFEIQEIRYLTAQSVTFDPAPIAHAWLQQRAEMLPYETLLNYKCAQGNGYTFLSARFVVIDQDDEPQGTELRRDYQVLYATTDALTDYFVQQLNQYGQMLSFAPLQVFSREVFFSWFCRTQQFVRVLAKFYFEGGATKIVQLHVDEFLEGVWHFRFDAATLATAAGTAYERVDFWLRDYNDTNISTFLKFVSSTGARYLVFFNQTGGIDQLALRGKAAHSEEYDRATAIFDNLQRNVYTRRTQVFEINTGYIAQYGNQRALANWITAEALTALRAYLFTEEALIEVLIKNTQAPTADDAVQLHNIDIELHGAKILKAFTTPVLALPDTDGVNGYFVPGYIQNNYYGNS